MVSPLTQWTNGLMHRPFRRRHRAAPTPARRDAADIRKSEFDMPCDIHSILVHARHSKQQAAQQAQQRQQAQPYTSARTYAAPGPAAARWARTRSEAHKQPSRSRSGAPLYIYMRLSHECERSSVGAAMCRHTSRVGERWLYRAVACVRTPQRHHFRSSSFFCGLARASTS